MPSELVWILPQPGGPSTETEKNSPLEATSSIDRNRTMNVSRRPPRAGGAAGSGEAGTLRRSPPQKRAPPAPPDPAPRGGRRGQRRGEHLAPLASVEAVAPVHADPVASGTAAHDVAARVRDVDHIPAGTPRHVIPAGREQSECVCGRRIHDVVRAAAA